MRRVFFTIFATHVFNVLHFSQTRPSGGGGGFFSFFLLNCPLLAAAATTATGRGGVGGGGGGGRVNNPRPNDFFCYSNSKTRKNTVSLENIFCTRSFLGCMFILDHLIISIFWFRPTGIKVFLFLAGQT